MNEITKSQKIEDAAPSTYNSKVKYTLGESREIILSYTDLQISNWKTQLYVFRLKCPGPWGFDRIPLRDTKRRKTSRDGRSVSDFSGFSDTVGGNNRFFVDETADRVSPQEFLSPDYVFNHLSDKNAQSVCT